MVSISDLEKSPRRDERLAVGRASHAGPDVAASEAHEVVVASCTAFLAALAEGSGSSHQGGREALHLRAAPDRVVLALPGEVLPSPRESPCGRGRGP